MVQTKWIIKNSEIDKKKSLVENLLKIRGITKKADIKEFLNPLEMKLSDPTVFSDMEKAVERISKAIDNNEKILIYGDFDADGITSTSILLKTFKFLNANADYFIPDREADNHGMNNTSLVKLLAEKKMKLVITVDCGISNAEQVKFLKTFKVDCIITDHHEAPDTLPEACAIINPKAPNALDKDLPMKKIEHLTSLAGCGVAFKLAQALLIHYKKTEFINDLIPFVAVGTVADIVPLIGENRYFVQKGLNLISEGKHYGLKRLLEQAGCNLENITSDTIAFSVAPRINACGRLDDIHSALNVFISENKQEIEMAIMEMNNFNKVRQELCNEAFLQACEMVNKNESAIILFNKDWHVGIIGIVASKLVETYHKPAFLMTYSDITKNIRCSARSIKGIHLYETISNIEELIDGFGGHELAAGLSFREEKSSFEKVKKALLTIIDEKSKTVDLTPTLEIDCELSPENIDLSLVEEISQLEPFGAENPSPTFCIKNATLKKKMLMGQDKNHLKLFIEKDDKEFQCVWWNHGDIPLIEKDTLDIAFSPQLNEFRGEISLQLLLKDIHSEYLEEQENKKNNSSEIKFFDHRKKKDIFNAVNDYCKTSKTDILVFAEDKTIIEELKPYKDIFSKIVNTNNLKKSETLMFFDYPTDEEHYQKIMDIVLPHRVHFMEYKSKSIKPDEFIKTLSGMIRYTINNKDGIFEIDKASSFLAVNNIAVTTALELLYNEHFINIKNSTETQCKLEFGTKTDLKEIKSEELDLILKDIYEFKSNMLLEDEI